MDAEAYSKHVTAIIQHSHVGIAMALGQKLGLVQAMYDSKNPITSAELAKKLKFKERYTREWLSCMTASNLIQIERDTGRFYIPEDHKRVLPPLATFSLILLHIGDNVKFLTECFKEDGPFGISYEDTPDFYNWHDAFRSTVSPRLIDRDIIVGLDKFGFKHKLLSGIRVLDLGCATGHFTCGLARRFPSSQFVGLDISQHALKVAKEEVEREGLKNVEIVQGDAMNLPADWEVTFDLVLMSDVLHDLPDPQKATREVHRILNDDGLFFISEFNVHSKPEDNVGDMTAAMLYCDSLFICLMSSMSAEPHVGYGACWGQEDTGKCVEHQGFVPADDRSVAGNRMIYYYTKNKKK